MAHESKETVRDDRTCSQPTATQRECATAPPKLTLAPKDLAQGNEGEHKARNHLQQPMECRTNRPARKKVYRPQERLTAEGCGGCATNK